MRQIVIDIVTQAAHTHEDGGASEQKNRQRSRKVKKSQLKSWLIKLVKNAKRYAQFEVRTLAAPHSKSFIISDAKPSGASSITAVGTGTSREKGIKSLATPCYKTDKDHHHGQGWKWLNSVDEQRFNSAVSHKNTLKEPRDGQCGNLEISHSSRSGRRASDEQPFNSARVTTIY